MLRFVGERMQQNMRRGSKQLYVYPEDRERFEVLCEHDERERRSMFRVLLREACAARGLKFENMRPLNGKAKR